MVRAHPTFTTTLSALQTDGLGADAAADAATDAADAGDERASNSARDFIRAIDGRRTFYNTISGRKEDAIDFYQPYPSLQ